MLSSLYTASPLAQDCHLVAFPGRSVSCLAVALPYIAASMAAILFDEAMVKVGGKDWTFSMNSLPQIGLKKAAAQGPEPGQGETGIADLSPTSSRVHAAVQLV